MLKRLARTPAFTIGTVLMVIMLCLVLAFAVASSSVFTLNMASTTDNRARARNLADTAIARGAEAMEQAANANTLPAFGTHGETYVLPPGPAGGLSCLSFAANNPYGVTPSTNNINNPQAVVGPLGTTIPPGCVDLIGLGQSGACVVKEEAVVAMPPFAYSVASSGRFSSPLGGLVVAALDPGVAFTSFPTLPLNPADQDPANMASNSAQTPMAVVLGPGSLVTGNVDASGNIQVNPSAQVIGSLLPDSNPVALPMVDLSVDPGAGVLGQQSISSLSGNATLTGFVHATQSLTCSSLTLNGAVLYVTGDVTINGPLSGSGALLTTGAITVTGGANVQATDVVVLAAGGNVTLTGNSANNTFVGMVYTAGNFVANNLQLYGQFVANGTGANDGSVTVGVPTGNMVINNSTVVQVPSLLNVGWVWTSSTEGTCDPCDGNKINSNNNGRGGLATCNGNGVCGAGSDGALVYASVKCNDLVVTVKGPNGGSYSSPFPIPCTSDCPCPCPCPVKKEQKHLAKDTSQYLKSLQNSPQNPFPAPVCVCSTCNQCAIQGLVKKAFCCPGATVSTGGGVLQVATPAQLLAGQAAYTFSMNQFISPADRVRVLSWLQL